MVPEPELDIKFCIWLPPVNIYNLFPCITAYYVKRKQIFKEKFAFYGLDMELEPEPEPEP